MINYIKSVNNIVLGIMSLIIFLIGNYKYIKITDNVIIENSNFKNLDFRFFGNSEQGIINFKNLLKSFNKYITFVICATG